MVGNSTTDGAGEQRTVRRADRQREMSEFIMAEGNVRIDSLAERFGVSIMTVHRDLDELEERGLLRKSRGVATAMSTSLVESSDVYRLGRQRAEKEAIAHAALEYVESGQAIFLDDSTTVLQLAKLLKSKRPLTVITNMLTTINLLAAERGISLVALGGNYYNWCSAFMDRMTIDAISKLRADAVLMSASAVCDDIAFHQSSQSVDTKRAMFDSAARRILLVDHSKFGKRALHAIAPLSDFDTVIVDWATSPEDVQRLRSQGIEVIVAPERRSGSAPADSD